MKTFRVVAVCALALLSGSCNEKEETGPGVIEFTHAVYWVDETDGVASITLSRTGGDSGFVVPILSIESETARTPDDYSVAGYSLYWDDGESGTRSVPIQIVDGGDTSGNKTVRLRLLDLGDAVLGERTEALLVIRDDESPASPLVFTRTTNALFGGSLAAVEAPGDPGHVYVVQQSGAIWAVSKAGASSEFFLDITDRVSSPGVEAGLLGLAFDPNFATNRHFYVNYTGGSLETRISRFTALSPTQADPGSEVILLSYPQPDDNHNGGWLAFGPDGKLYIGSGDGGGANDPDGNGQNLDTLLGKILRINADGSAPADNPFAADGNPATRAEIWAYGFRNPWRGGFDRQTGELWVADVGQDAREEIDLVVAGGNYGWDACEGTVCAGAAPAGHVPPIFEYAHDVGQSITGGYRYRGSIAAANGKYFYGDFITGQIWALDYNGAVVSNVPVARVDLLSSFGEGLDGELYAVTYGGALYRLIAP